MAGDGRASGHEAEADSLSLRCLVLLDQLLPVERAVFLLHHVLGCSLAETAGAVGVSEASCRELLLGVRCVMRAAKPRIETERRERRDVTRRFIAGVRDGDPDLVARLLAPDVIAYVDATQPPIVGRRNVVRLISRTRDVGGMSLDIAGGLVQTVRWPASGPGSG